MEEIRNLQKVINPDKIKVIKNALSSNIKYILLNEINSFLKEYPGLSNIYKVGVVGYGFSQSELSYELHLIYDCTIDSFYILYKDLNEIENNLEIKINIEDYEISNKMIYLSLKEFAIADFNTINNTNIEKELSDVYFQKLINDNKP